MTSSTSFGRFWTLVLTPALLCHTVSGGIPFVSPDLAATLPLQAALLDLSEAFDFEAITQPPDDGEGQLGARAPAAGVRGAEALPPHVVTVLATRNLTAAPLDLATASGMTLDTG